MSNDNSIALVNWKADTALALAQQIMQRVKDAMDKNQKVGVVVCFVSETAPGTNVYEPAFSVMPMECAAWAGGVIVHAIMSGDVDRKLPQS